MRFSVPRSQNTDPLIQSLSDPSRYPIQTLSDPYAIRSIHYPIHTLSDPYAIWSIRYPIHTLSDPYISDPYGCSSAEFPINLSFVYKRLECVDLQSGTENRCMIRNEIYDQKTDVWSENRCMTRKQMYDQKTDVWSKNRCIIRKQMYDQKKRRYNSQRINSLLF